MWIDLSSSFGVLQAPFFECPPFYFLPFQQYCLPTPGIDIGGREVFQALMITPVIVMTDKLINSGFKIALKEVILEQDAVF